MNEAIKITGIKCDTPHCNYKDDTIQFEDYPNWVNKPCPLCGRNLLTQSEYEQSIKLIKTIGQMNKVFHSLRWLNPMFYYNEITGRKPKKYHKVYKFPYRKI